MATLQISETQIACRKHDVVSATAGLGLTQAPVADEESNVQVTKLKAGCTGTVFLMGETSDGTGTIMLKAEADETLDFTSGTTDHALTDAGDNFWMELEVNGDTKKYWGIKVDNPASGFEWTKLVVLETSEISIADGENYHVATAAFNAKHVADTGAIDTAFPV